MASNTEATGMEVDEGSNHPQPESEDQTQVEMEIMAAAGTAGSVTTSLHPLVIMNISEHWTRTKAQMGKPQKVYGALIGKQKGRHIEVMNSFELFYNVLDDKTVIDREYYNNKESQFKQVFSDQDFLGWYTTGEAPTEDDIYVQKQICEINESPLLLLLNPFEKNSDLPLTIYESVLDIVKGQTRTLFVKLNYALATEEAERIGLDHVARISNVSDASRESKVSETFSVQFSAIKMLLSRLTIVIKYVNAVEEGELEFNHAIMRDVKGLVDRFPVLGSANLMPEFYTQSNDVALITLLGTIQKSCSSISQFVSKFNLLYQKQGQVRRIRTSFV